MGIVESMCCQAKSGQALVKVWSARSNHLECAKMDLSAFGKGFWDYPPIFAVKAGQTNSRPTSF
jgi:hypothetical protein